MNMKNSANSSQEKLEKTDSLSRKRWQNHGLDELCMKVLRAAANVSNTLSPALPVAAATVYVMNDAAWNFPDYGPEGLTSTIVVAAIAAAGGKIMHSAYKSRRRVADWFNRQNRLLRSTAAYTLLAANIIGSSAMPMSSKGLWYRYGHLPGAHYSQKAISRFHEYSPHVDAVILKYHNDLSHDKQEKLAASSKGLATAESAWSPKSVSPRGALGIMQLMPNTAKKLGVNPKNVFSNIKGGIQYYREGLENNNWDVRRAVTCYFRGNGKKRIPRHGPTYKHIKNVIVYTGRIESAKFDFAPWIRYVKE